MGWSKKYKNSINCKSPKGFSQKAHCQGRKKRNENYMKLSEFKEVVREISRNKFYESLNEALSKISFGKETYTKRGLTPTDVLALTMAYHKEDKITKLMGGAKKLDYMVNTANDLANLTGGSQLAPAAGGTKSLVFGLLKNKLITKDEYVTIIKDLNKKHKQVIKYMKNASHPMRGTGGAAKRDAMRDMGL